jgi:prevent-host-death family protein
VDEAGPQVITRRGRQVAVVVSMTEWQHKTRRAGSLAEFFAQSPLPGSGLETPPREKEGMREVIL